jgi:hypothetical protein
MRALPERFASTSSRRIARVALQVIARLSADCSARAADHATSDMAVQAASEASETDPMKTQEQTMRRIPRARLCAWGTSQYSATVSSENSRKVWGSEST